METSAHPPKPADKTKRFIDFTLETCLKLHLFFEKIREHPVWILESDDKMYAYHFAKSQFIVRREILKLPHMFGGVTKINGCVFPECDKNDKVDFLLLVTNSISDTSAMRFFNLDHENFDKSVREFAFDHFTFNPSTVFTLTNGVKTQTFQCVRPSGHTCYNMQIVFAEDTKQTAKILTCSEACDPEQYIQGLVEMDVSEMRLKEAERKKIRKNASLFFQSCLDLDSCVAEFIRCTSGRAISFF